MRRSSTQSGRGELSLEQLQQWFQSELVRPHERPRAARPSTSPRPRSVVTPSARLTPSERVAIYTRSYFARLHDCLADDYKTVFELVPAGEFKRLVREYLTAYPATHYSLGKLGRHFPRYLESAERLSRRGLLVDLARLELAVAEVFDEEETTSLTKEAFQALPPAGWSTATLTPIAAFRLLSFEHRANAIHRAVRQDKRLPPLTRCPTWVAVYRKNYVVWRLDLSQARFKLLESLASGRTILDSIEAAAGFRDGTIDEFQKDLFEWFADWVGDGLFQAIGRQSKG